MYPSTWILIDISREKFNLGGGGVHYKYNCLRSNIEPLLDFRTLQIIFGSIKEFVYWVSDSPLINFVYCLNELRNHQGVYTSCLSSS